MVFSSLVYPVCLCFLREIHPCNKKVALKALSRIS